MTTNKPTELVVTQAEQKAVEEWLTECTDGRVSDQTKLMLRLFSHWLHDRLASTAPASDMAGDELRKGKDELLRLLNIIWRSEYRLEAPDWQPLPDLVGMVSQIDNMFAGIRSQRDEAIAALRPASEDDVGWKDAKEIAAAAVQSACESDPADEEHPDTILISADDLETIVRCAVENHFEARAALRPRSEREEIANWLREDAPQWGHEALANAIERGDFKEPSK